MSVLSLITTDLRSSKSPTRSEIESGFDHVLGRVSAPGMGSVMPGTVFHVISFFCNVPLLTRFRIWVYTCSHVGGEELKGRAAECHVHKARDHGFLMCLIEPEICDGRDWST